MSHPFQDKLFVFIGKPIRCSRQEIRDALLAVGGVTDDTLTTFTDFALAMKGSENTKIYKRALWNERCGLLSILSEDLFFDILDGKAALPEKPDTIAERAANMIPIEKQKAWEIESNRLKHDVIEHKRIKSMAKHGIPTPEGRMKIDFRNLYTASKFVEYLEEEYNAVSNMDRCDICGNPATVYISGDPDVSMKLCVNCNNRQIAVLTGTEVPPNIPEQVTMNDIDGRPHTFEIEFMMFPHGITLIAAEVGKTRYKAEVFGAIDKGFDELWELLLRQIKGFLSVKYMSRGGYIIGGRAIGYIEYNHKRDAHDIVIDGKPYTWQELEKNITAHEGFRIRIEFFSSGDILD